MEWAQAKLGEFSEEQLKAGYDLICGGFFSHIIADGTGPVYCENASTSTKLRSVAIRLTRSRDSGRLSRRSLTEAGICAEGQ